MTTNLVEGQVLEAKNRRRFSSATHAVIVSVKTNGENVVYELRSVKIEKGKPEFFWGAQRRQIPAATILKRYKTTNITMMKG